MTMSQAAALGRARQAHNGFDRTGLIVWPCSLLLARFLASALGRNNSWSHLLFHFPPASTRNSSASHGTIDSTFTDVGSADIQESPSCGRPDVSTDDEEKNKVGGGRGTTFSSGYNSTRVGGEGVHMHDDSCLKPHLGCGDGANVQGVRPTSLVTGGNEPTQMSETLPHFLEGSRTVNIGPGKRLEYATLARFTRRNERITVLELGAGTGVCGLTAATAIGCSVLLTDRSDEVIENLEANVALNGLEDKVRVVRLAWGGLQEFALPPDVEDHAPFEVSDVHNTSLRREKMQNL